MSVKIIIYAIPDLFTRSGIPPITIPIKRNLIISPKLLLLNKKVIHFAKKMKPINAPATNLSRKPICFKGFLNNPFTAAGINLLFSY